MKLIFTFFLFLLSFSGSAQRCLTPNYISNHPFNNFITKRVSSLNNSKMDSLRDTLGNEVITVPVIVHVLYNNNNQNISDAQVISQIVSLNNDFRRQNADTINTPQPFKSVAADTRIQFCLAKVDPNGRYTTGIIHKYTSVTEYSADDAMKFSSQGGDDAWDASKYLNIWVCNLFGRTLGYAVLPGSPANKDGIVIQYDVFGTIGNLLKSFDKGRTVTHELGHWLGLKHPWGDSDCGDDGIADTPPQEAANSGCPSFPHTSSCSINPYGDMFMDYMDFTNDACMNMFTKGQAAEMRSLFAEGGFRNSFLNSTACDSSNAEGGPLPTKNPDSITLKITIYPNPFDNIINITSTQDDEIIGQSLNLYGTNGKLYLSQIIGSNSTTLNTSKLVAGIYILKIEGKKGTHIYKLIKINTSR